MRRVWIGVIGVLATACSGASDAASAGRAPDWHGEVQQPAVPRPDFTLRTTDGTPFDFRRETAARTTLLFYGYTSCPDVCPVHLANIAAVLRKMPASEAREVQVIFVTTDPKRDTPERVRAWLDQFDPRFVGLIGTPAEVDSAQRAAGLQPAAGDTARAEYTVAHAAVIFAITRDDSAHVVYPFGVRQEGWAQDLPRLTSMWPAPMELRDPYVIAPAPDVAALYFEMHALPGNTDTLLAVEIAAAARSAVHLHEARGSMMVMRPAGPLAVRDTVKLERGGTHVMLEGLERPLAAGDTVEAVLVFSKAGRRVIRAPVRPVME